MGQKAKRPLSYGDKGPVAEVVGVARDGKNRMWRWWNAARGGGGQHPGMDAGWQMAEPLGAVVEYCHVILLTSCRWPFNPYQMTGEDANSKLISQCQLASILVRCKCIAFRGSTFLKDTEVGTINAH